MKTCNCLAKIEASNKTLKEIRKELCPEHRKNFWKWTGNYPEV